jgi:hypothetical protein
MYRFERLEIEGSNPSQSTIGNSSEKLNNSIMSQKVKEFLQDVFCSKKVQTTDYGLKLNVKTVGTSQLEDLAILIQGNAAVDSVQLKRSGTGIAIMVHCTEI